MTAFFQYEDFSEKEVSCEVAQGSILVYGVCVIHRAKYYSETRPSLENVTASGEV